MKTADAIILEKTTEKFIDSLKGAKPIYKLTPEEARNLLETVQSGPVDKSAVITEDKTIPGPKGQTKLRIYRPKDSKGKLPAVVYIHGAGWVMGSANTHARLMSDLAVQSNSAVIYVDYSRSPEAKYPTAIEEAYSATKYIAEHADELNVDTSHLILAGDSVGGNMVIALTFLAKERKGPKIDAQILFYPVTSSDLNTESYHQFADGPWLTKPAMEWFWNAYEPNAQTRKNILLSPLNATIDQLKGLPRAIVITAECDVLRDEGEEYAHKLMQAGVDVTAVRFEGTIHDFAMLNALAKTPAAVNAIALASQFIKKR